MNFKENFIYTLVVIFLLFIVPVGFVYLCAISYTNEQTIEITIKDKYIKNSEDAGKYIVVDTNGNSYEITDLTFLGKFNSTDIYNQIEIGKTYKITITGRRIHFLSYYPNINKIEVIDDEK